MVLKLVLFVNLCLLQFKGVSPKTVSIDRFSRAGQDSTLPCDTLKHRGPSCSRVDWFYSNNLDHYLTEVSEGKVEENSPRSSRLRLNTDCSLIVHNVTDEDSGLYTCRLLWWTDEDTDVYLSVLTVSPAPPSLNPNQDGSITFSCTLLRHRSQFCRQNSLLWLDQTGTVLSGTRITQNKCFSHLTVERQSEHRKYTCQYVDERNTVLIAADYTPEVRRTGERGNTGLTEVFIGVGAVASLLVLLVVAAVVFFKIRAKRSAAETTEDTEGDTKPADSAVDFENNVTYARINHQKVSKKKMQVVMEEDTVTYSAVNIKTAPDSSAIYSTVNKTKV